MKYLIIYQGTVYYTNWYDKENNYIEGMTVVNMLSHKYTTNGETWLEVEEDTL